MFKKPFSFKGRIRRTEIIITYFVAFFMHILSLHALESDNRIAIVLALILMPILYWLVISQSVKRAHDIGESAWWLFFPLYGYWLMFVKGEPQINKYGINPKRVRSKDKE